MRKGDAERFLLKEKLRLIGEILDIYFLVTPEDTTKQYWYGDTFDTLYEKNILELRIALAVYEHSKMKTTIK